VLLDAQHGLRPKLVERQIAALAAVERLGSQRACGAEQEDR
jgi:hypothetical protein